ncbi:MAG: hypothetical protein AAGC46_02620 [Solirubrobacteraceae bacterium]|nr:hypothetical protein [Patulibacter sp.]
MSTSSLSALRAATPRALALAAVVAAVAPAGALAAGAPLPSIGEAPVHRSDNSYTLYDYVDPNGAITDTTFEYGTGSGSTFDHTAAGPTVAGSSGDTLVSANTVVFPVGTQVHYRLHAHNAYGDAYSGVLSYTVTGTPIITPGASPVRNASGSFTLRSLVDPQGLSTGVRIEYGPTTSYGTLISSIVVSPGPAQQAPIITSDDLVSGTTVHYRAIATNDNGTTTQADQSFVVPSGTPIVTPGLAPVHNSSGSTTVRGRVNPNGYSTSAYIEYGTTTSYGNTISSLVVSPGAPQQVPAIIPVYPVGTVVHYRVRATNSIGTTYGADQTFTQS